MSKTLVPNVAEMSTEQLVELDGQLVEMFNTTREAGITVSSTIELAEIASAIDEVRAESGRRAEFAKAAKSKAEEQIEALAARVMAGAPTTVELDGAGVSDGVRQDDGGAGKEDDEETPPKDPVRALAAEGTVTAAAEHGKLSPATATGTAPTVAPVPANPGWQGTPTIVASADISGYAAGATVESTLDIARMMVARHRGLSGTSKTGDGDKVKVASVMGSFPDERILSDSDVETNMAKIDAVVGRQALVASGGICAPAEPYYGQLNISSVDRPVKASLPTFMADRGSIRFIPPPVISSLNGAITVVTQAQDASGGSSATKNVLHITCAAEQHVFVTAISRILEFGNFGSRTFPEQVEVWVNLSIAQTARRAEQYLLDQISASSTQITTAQTFGASRQILAQVAQAAAAYRSRHRTDPNLMLRVMFPVWIKQAFRADLARTWTADIEAQFAVTDAEIDNWFAVRNIAPTYYLDSTTTGGQVFGTQNAGALLTFPSTVQWGLWAEGSFLHLDAGTLDLGLVRDSTLNSTNDYEIFAEVFENVAFVGVESYWVTSTFCADGSYAPAGSALSCPA